MINLSPEQRALLTDEERNSLELLEKATAGEWLAETEQPLDCVVFDSTGEWLANIGAADIVPCVTIKAELDDDWQKIADMDEANAAHIADAHNRMADMLAKIARLRERMGQATAFNIGEDAQVKSCDMGKHGTRWFIKLYDEHGEWFLYGGVKQQFGGSVDGTYPTADAAFAALEAWRVREKGEGE